MPQFIATDSAPAAIGTYSQAIAHGGCLYISGQIPLQPKSMERVNENIDAQISQVFANIDAICHAADTSLDKAIKFTVYLTDLSHFSRVNDIMAKLLTQPYPARAVIEVSRLPRGVQVEIDAIVALPE